MSLSPHAWCTAAAAKVGRPLGRVAAGGRDLYLHGERGAGERGVGRSDRYRSMVSALERGRATAGGAARCPHGPGHHKPATVSGHTAAGF